MENLEPQIYGRLLNVEDIILNYKVEETYVKFIHTYRQSAVNLTPFKHVQNKNCIIKLGLYYILA